MTDDRKTAIKRKRTRSQIDKRACDELFSQIIRHARRCRRCHTTTGQLQCAHIVSRRYAATRCDPRNAWCLCAGCHLRLTQHPDEHVQFAHDTIGEQLYETLRTKAYAGERPDWTELRAILADTARRLGIR